MENARTAIGRNYGTLPLDRSGEDIAWNFVNIFHRAADKQERHVDEAREQIGLLIAKGYSSEFSSSNLEELIARTAFRQLKSIPTAREGSRLT